MSVRVELNVLQNNFQGIFGEGRVLPDESANRRVFPDMQFRFSQGFGRADMASRFGEQRSQAKSITR